MVRGCRAMNANMSKMVWSCLQIKRLLRQTDRHLRRALCIFLLRDGGLSSRPLSKRQFNSRSRFTPWPFAQITCIWLQSIFQDQSELWCSDIRAALCVRFVKSVFRVECGQTDSTIAIVLTGPRFKEKSIMSIRICAKIFSPATFVVNEWRGILALKTLIRYYGFDFVVG